MPCTFYFGAVFIVGNFRGLVIVISIIFMIFFFVMLFVCVFALWCILLNFMWFVEKNLMWCILLPKKLFDLLVVLFFCHSVSICFLTGNWFACFSDLYPVQRNKVLLLIFCRSN